MGFIEAGGLRKGLAVMFEGNPHILVDVDFVKPGKGQALYKCRMRNLTTEREYERTFRSGDRFETADIQEQNLQFLYADSENLHFMHMESFEQLEMAKTAAGNAIYFLQESMIVKALLYDGRPIGIELPNFVEAEVTYAEPWLKGDTASGATKPVELASGYKLQAPLFVNQGDMVRIDTRTGSYVERVKK